MLPASETMIAADKMIADFLGADAFFHTEVT
jgi:hypothetical protein